MDVLKPENLFDDIRLHVAFLLGPTFAAHIPQSPQTFQSPSLGRPGTSDVSAWRLAKGLKSTCFLRVAGTVTLSPESFEVQVCPKIGAQLNLAQ